MTIFYSLTQNMTLKTNHKPLISLLSIPVSVPALENLVRRYGFGDMCCRVRAADIPVLDLESNSEEAILSIKKQLERALAEDGAEGIILGWAGMVDLSRTVTSQYHMPVIDGVGAAIKLVEGLPTLGLPTSSLGGYASPPEKSYSGVLARYSPDTEA